jgi:protein-tyrosine phosphatase
MSDCWSSRIRCGDKSEGTDLGNIEDITAVVNVALEPDDPIDGSESIHVPMEDGEQFDRALAAISAHIESGRVLVHCVMGVSRSAVVVALFFATTEGITLDAAVSLLTLRRQSSVIVRVIHW